MFSKFFEFDGQIRELSDGTKEAYLPPADLENHCAFLLETKEGDILCLFWAGLYEDHFTICDYVCRLKKGESKWSKPMRITHSPEAPEQNAILFKEDDGTIWLIHTFDPSRNQNDAVIMVSKSKDGGRTFSKSEVLFDTKGTFIRQPVAKVSNGDILVPVYHCEGKRSENYCGVMISCDNGKTFKEYFVPECAGLVQMAICELSDHSLYAVFRDRFSRNIYESRSNDFGRTWEVPTPTVFSNNNSSIALQKISDGSLVLVFNNTGSIEASGSRDGYSIKHNAIKTSTLRNNITIARSFDGGKTYPIVACVQEEDEFYKNRDVLDIYNRREYSYPAAMQDSNGNLHIAYTYNRMCIKHKIIPIGLLEKR